MNYVTISSVIFHRTNLTLYNIEYNHYFENNRKYNTYI